MNNKNVGMKTADKTELITELAEAGRKLSDADLDLLTKDSEARLTYKDLLECRTALQMDFDNDVPDAKAEWKRFQQRIQPDTPAVPHSDERTITAQGQSRKPVSMFIWGLVAGIAASLLILFVYSWTTGTDSLTPNRIASNRTATSSPYSPIHTRTSPATGKHTNTQNAQPGQTATAGTKARSASSPVSLQDKKLLAAAGVTDSPDMQLYPDGVKERTASISDAKDLKVVLPDGTVVWMNAASRITYPEVFIGKERIVTLDGEAYFEVKHDPDHPFIILARNITARVLGTELNVSSYANKTPHVTLIRGKVEVGSATSGRITLRPGQDASLTDNGNIAVREVDTAKYKYWKDGYLYFDNESLASAMQAVSSWYNVKVVFQKKGLTALRIHFFCDRHRPVEDVIANLKKIYNLDVNYKNRTIFIK